MEMMPDSQVWGWVWVSVSFGGMSQRMFLPMAVEWDDF